MSTSPLISREALGIILPSRGKPGLNPRLHRRMVDLIASEEVSEAAYQNVVSIDAYLDDRAEAEAIEELDAIGAALEAEDIAQQKAPKVYRAFFVVLTAAGRELYRCPCHGTADRVRQRALLERRLMRTERPPSCRFQLVVLYGNKRIHPKDME